jgi:hypothetical protein
MNPVLKLIREQQTAKRKAQTLKKRMKSKRKRKQWYKENLL